MYISSPRRPSFTCCACANGSGVSSGNATLSPSLASECGPSVVAANRDASIVRELTRLLSGLGTAGACASSFFLASSASFTICAGTVIDGETHKNDKNQYNIPYEMQAKVDHEREVQAQRRLGAQHRQRRLTVMGGAKATLLTLPGRRGRRRCLLGRQE